MNVRNITKYILLNYDENVDNFINLLHEINCELIYNDSGLQSNIVNKKVYSCSIRFKTKKNKIKILENVFPIMIGSKLDIGIRKLNISEFKSLSNIPNLLEYWENDDKTFELPDIALTCFLINGSLKQIPFFITNDSSNVHIVSKSIVRLYRYDSEMKGAQLSMYFDNIEGFQAGDLILKSNNGISIKMPDKLNDFFECPYDVKTKTYFTEMFSQDFNIDNIENKIAISPGNLFYKLFAKTLLIPLKGNDLALIRKKHLIVTKSIENGDLLHIISKKTIFHKEMNFKNKMVDGIAQNDNFREITQNGEVFLEKKTTCYRDVNCQYYPYLPYLSHFAQIQISSKVKNPKVLSFNDSYIGFFCVYGTSESKNAGRAMLLARDVFVSTRGNLKELYQFLKEKLIPGFDELYIVINSACIQLTKSSFQSVDLLQLKRHFLFIECYQKNNFIHINYKIGLLFKKLEDDVWVTSRELSFWMLKLYNFTKIDQILEHKGYPFITSYSADIIKYNKHNAYPKNILTLNALKSAVLSYTPKYSLYFFETVSAYSQLTNLHEPILVPENKLSSYFTMYLPKLNLMYASFKGLTQEDSIVMDSKVKVFDCFRFYTVKIKFRNKNSKYFHAASGPPNPMENKSFLGTVVCPTNKIIIMSQTMHLLTKKLDENVLQIFFTKPKFQVLNWHISETFLFVSISTFHECDFGDKLCSLHGQKGVVSILDSLPGSIYQKPDLIINPYCLISRQTMGQLIESIDLGGQDYDCLINSDGKPIAGTAFIGPVHYFAISFWCFEHTYLAKRCVKDKITGQPVRGRSRQGGMRLGNMEFFNCFIGNGLASSFEEKTIEHSDRIILEDVAIPKSVFLCREDMRFFKCNITYETEPIIQS